MKAEINNETAAAVERALCTEHGMVIAYKGGALWDAVGTVMDILRIAGLKVPSGREFNERFATNLLGVLALPRDLRLSPMAMVLLLTHEATHSTQWRGDMARMPVWYLQHREKRAGYEAGAIAQALAVQWALTAELPVHVDELPSGLVYGYDLTPDDRQLAQDELEQEVTAIAAGIVPIGPARTALAVIARLQPDALDAKAAELIRARSPGVL